MISAIVVNYHLAESAVRAVKSLVSSGRDEPVEIFLVDNSESYEQAEKLRTAVGKDCTLIVSERNLGFGAACNLAYQQASGDWILLLNPDAWLAQGAAQTLYEFLKANPEAGAVSPRVYWDETQRFLLPANSIPNPRQDVLNAPKGRLGGLLTWWHSLSARSQAVEYWTSKWPLQQEMLSGGHIMLRRRAIESAGGLFDERFYMYYEDTDLFVRLKQASYHSYMVPDALVTHSFAQTPQPESWKQEQMQKSHLQFLQKHYAKPNNLTRMMKWLQGGARWLPQIEELGVLDAPPELEVPKSIQRHWLLECSLSPYFMPSAGLFGKGDQVIIPDETWQVMSPGKYFLRLGSPEYFYLPPKVISFNK
ncbi:MAG: glycosyltransferase family 2 protein [Pseudomonadota bacterium]